MDDRNECPSPTFLDFEEKKELDRSVFWLNMYLNGFQPAKKPYKIDYNTLLVSYHLWQGDDLDEFCFDQANSYFLFNPEYDSRAAREALFLEIREFLSGG
ncbi:MAG: hypothetical protein CMH48_11970 [Muricauda sp.]|uniref:Uncharacterized protein n=1 Tax=Flagellimonas lutaonensis TaxID=516051 RepID=A0A0D5YNW0_9FLAO|nr:MULTISPECIES: hypothetical protein [Allomuricauda]AKA33917.1 hypothetical protein VC82_230 [Allomuricauda lutaonensis]MAU25918.1 hypothetical protein [Allomuricauda sp.]MBC31549.1 hypothetical protein [Allomuricauda sp.]|tara:strand:+ start:969 stop:1268 length:300 start_codon:yes stop_codon:yes gene_type:complete